MFTDPSSPLSCTTVPRVYKSWAGCGAHAAPSRISSAAAMMSCSEEANEKHQPQTNNHGAWQQISKSSNRKVLLGQSVSVRQRCCCSRSRRTNEEAHHTGRVRWRGGWLKPVSSQRLSNSTLERGAFTISCLKWRNKQVEKSEVPSQICSKCAIFLLIL